MVLVIIGLVYVIYQFTKASIEEEKRRDYSRRNGYKTYFDDRGRMREVDSGNICISTVDGLEVYNKKTGNFEKRY